MCAITRPVVVRNCGITDYIKHLLSTRGDMSLFLEGF